MLSTLPAPVAVLALLVPLLPRQETIGSLPLAQAAACFEELAEASARDGGKLWGVPLGGPVLLLDPVSRKLASNQADAEGALAAREGVFVGELPRDKPVANAPIEVWGVRWATVMVTFLGETRQERVALLAHESFHRVQPQLGLYVFGAETDHLDTLEGRLWLQLEWNALQEALEASGAARSAAARDALDFRAARRARFPRAAERENALELREGLASYTGMRLAEHTDASTAALVAAKRAREEGFVRSFAYFSGPLYGFLLDGARADWRKALDGKSDLGALLAAALALEPSAPRAAECAREHGGEALRASEEERERRRLTQLAAWRAVLVDGPVLVLDLSQVTSGAMDTRKVHPFDEGRLVYTARTLIAKWGKLSVDGGAILEDGRARLGRISLAGAADDKKSGPGWTLELAPGWTIGPGERAGDLALRPEP